MQNSSFVNFNANCQPAPAQEHLHDRSIHQHTQVQCFLGFLQHKRRGPIEPRCAVPSRWARAAALRDLSTGDAVGFRSLLRDGAAGIDNRRLLRFCAKFIIFNAKSIILNEQFIGFSTKLRTFIVQRI